MLVRSHEGLVLSLRYCWSIGTMNRHAKERGSSVDSRTVLFLGHLYSDYGWGLRTGEYSAESWPVRATGLSISQYVPAYYTHGGSRDMLAEMPYLTFK